MNTAKPKPYNQAQEFVTYEELDRELAAHTAPRWMRYLRVICDCALLALLALIAINVFL